MSLDVSVECYFLSIMKRSPPTILLTNELLIREYCFITYLLLFTASFCCTTVPLLLGVAQALGVSSVYVSDPSLITTLLFPKHSGNSTPDEPQLPRALSRAAPRRFLSFPQGNRDDSYHLSDTQLNNLIMKVSPWQE